MNPIGGDVDSLLIILNFPYGRILNAPWPRLLPGVSCWPRGHGHSCGPLGHRRWFRLATPSYHVSPSSGSLRREFTRFVMKNFTQCWLLAAGPDAGLAAGSQAGHSQTEKDISRNEFLSLVGPEARPGIPGPLKKILHLFV